MLHLVEPVKILGKKQFTSLRALARAMDQAGIKPGTDVVVKQVAGKLKILEGYRRVALTDDGGFTYSRLLFDY